jgi:glycosyltransferase involved in cell wall biosynthesis
MLRTLIIVPAHNEEAAIAGVVREIRATLAQAEVVVVDDHSSDDTAGRAREEGARVLKLPIHLGVGGAVRTGFQLAVDDGFDLAAQVDGDGQHPAGELPKLFAPLISGEADVTIGTRYRDDRGYATPVGRRAGQRFFSALVNLLTGGRYTDTTSGFRAYNRRAIRYLARNYSRDYPEVNAIVNLSQNAFRIREVPISMRDRRGGASSITLSRAIYYMAKVPLATLMAVGRRRERPADETSEV